MSPGLIKRVEELDPARVVAAMGSRLLAPDEARRLSRLTCLDAGHGYDPLGMHPAWVALGLGMARPAYERYFRVQSHGAHHIPPSGPAILAVNHSGMLPLDAIMLYADVLRHTDPPRVPRAVVDLFVGRLPFVGTFFTRGGATPGTRRNLHHLLETGELLMVFPEGAPAIGKDFRERYRLRPFRIGFAELAIRHRAPIVPVGIVGPEEQWPLRLRLDTLHPMGAPFLPVPLLPVPLPVRYHIRYGEPIDLSARHGPADSDDPDVTAGAAAEVQEAVRTLLARSLHERRGVFR